MPALIEVDSSVVECQLPFIHNLIKTENAGIPPSTISLTDNISFYNLVFGASLPLPFL